MSTDYKKNWRNKKKPEDLRPRKKKPPDQIITPKQSKARRADEIIKRAAAMSVASATAAAKAREQTLAALERSGPTLDAAVVAIAGALDAEEVKQVFSGGEWHASSGVPDHKTRIQAAMAIVSLYNGGRNIEDDLVNRPILVLDVDVGVTVNDDAVDITVDGSENK